MAAVCCPLSAAWQVLDKVYGMAPDCIPAQLLDAQLEMLAGNYEQVGRVEVGGG